MTETRQALATTVKLLVDRPEAVEITERSDADGVTFELRVAEDDLGKVIGRQGRTARALRTVLAAREAGGGETYQLEILD